MEKLFPVSPNEIRAEEVVPEETAPAKRKKTVGLIPRKFIVLCALAKHINETWKTKPLILDWTNPEVFGKLIDEFDESLSGGKSKKANNSPVKDALNNLDAKIARNTKFPKGYIEEHYDEDDPIVHFPRFGFTRKPNGRHYKLGHNREDRMVALEVLIKTLEEHGWQEKKFGSEYWRGILNEYRELYHASYSTDSAVTGHSRTNRSMSNEVKTTLSCIILMIKANNPGNEDQALREWGFHKEKFK